MVREYIGARYVPKFMGLYDTTQSYEALCVVDNGSGTSYISKIPTPAGTPLTDTTHWFVYGASSGAIIALQNDVNDLKNDIKGIVITPSMFGAVGDGITDDSQAVQDAFNYAKSIGCALVSFTDISTITFKDVIIDSSCDIFFGDCEVKAMKIDSNNERTENLFTIANQSINVTFHDGVFVGGYSTGTNIDPMNPKTAIEIDAANMIVFDDCFFKNFNNRNHVSIPSLLTDRKGIIANIHDVRNTIIANCKFDNCYGEELIYVLNNTLARKEVNLAVKKCRFTNIGTSVINFVGNLVELAANYYNINYAGSLVNIFGLYVDVHDDYVDGSVANVYDTCEETYFQNNSVSIRNVYIANANRAAMTAALEVEADNIMIGDVRDANYAAVVMCRPGYFSSNPVIHPDQATSTISQNVVKVKNCDASMGNSKVTFVHHAFTITGIKMIDIANCVTDVHLANSEPIIIDNGGYININDSVLYTRTLSSIGGSFFALPIAPAASFNGLIMKGCNIKNNNTSNVEYVVRASAGIPYIISACIADGSSDVGDVLNNAVVNGCINIA